MPDTFHPFPRLPVELRLAIWKLTLRTEGTPRPGAHFFGILVPEEDPDADSLMNQSFFPRNWRYTPNYRLIGPRWTTTSAEDRFVGIKQEPASWTDNNPSAYLVDSGLWLACRESQNLIKHAMWE